ncbi:MAG: hypothetical protein AB7E95_01120 [Kiritimatiellales bacterium]
MKKPWIGLAVTVIAGLVQAGSVSLPTEHIAIPLVSGTATIKVWDVEDQRWIFSTTSEQPTKFEFEVPEWDKWYWVGVWDHTAGKYVLGRWIGHEKTD